MSPFYFAGLINVPAGVTVIWTDDATGMIVDGDKVVPGAGLYYHVMMYNGVGNQLVCIVLACDPDTHLIV